MFHEEERNTGAAQSAVVTAALTSGANDSQLPDVDTVDITMSNPEDQTSMVIMNNYFGLGLDADVCLQFHNRVGALRCV